MVLENLTLFEVHLDNAQIGPKTTGGGDAEDEPTSENEPAVEDKSSDEGGPSIGRLIVASVLVSIVVSLVAWKLAGDDEEPEVAIDAPGEPDDGVGVTVED